jgi:adenylate cyclase
VKKINLLSLLAAILSAVIIILLYYKSSPFLEELEGRSLGLMFDVRGKKAPDPEIAIIAIDEKSLKEIGRWPWSRKSWAEFIKRVDRYDPRLIILDVWFSERESASADRDLLNALLNSDKVILPIVFEINESTSAPDISDWALDKSSITGTGFFLEGKGVIASLPEFNRAVKQGGHINVSLDTDGTIRWTPLIIRYKEDLYPSLALAASKELANDETLGVVCGERIDLGGATIPVDEYNRMLINYAGQEHTYPYYSLVDVVKGKIEKTSLKNKILLVGASAQGIYDMRVTPFSSNTPGVEVNANIIDNIRNSSFLVRKPVQRMIDIMFILSAGLLFGLIIPRVRAVLAFPFALSVILGYSALAFFFFTEGYWISTVYPILGMLFAYISSTAVRLFYGERKITEIRRMFASYVTKEIVDELIKNPEKARLGGQIKELTIIFCDLRGFTGYSERHSPGAVVSKLNEYFAAMTECIMKYNGTLDKFLGDGIMAFWNAPLDQENHPELALLCALDMRERFESLRRKWKSESNESWEIGIGINIGEVLVGNIGAPGRKMEYTVIGDNVNITHRIMDLTRGNEGNIIISGSLYKRVKDMVDADEIGDILLKGKEEPVMLISVKGLKKS